MGLSHHPDRRRLATTDRGRRNGGYILVTFALLLIPLLLMAGLSVDVGSWYNRASDLQKAADAASLAGVVWLPNEDKAEDYALEAAARNGFADGVDGIEITVAPVGERRLRVTIRDPQVPSFFFQTLGGHAIDLARRGTAEYVLPVPLGSPRNYFGTGSLLSDPELLYQSVNPACTSKVNGDRHQSLHFGPLDGASLSSCPDTPTNGEYRERGYELYIEAPEDRPAAIDVRLYDPRYSLDCVAALVVEYDDDITDLRRDTTVEGPLIYYYYDRGWRTRELAEGDSATARYVRYGQKVCPDPSPPPDSKRKSGDEDFTFTLLAPDDTPFDDSDNIAVPGCTKTYTKSSTLELSYLGSERWTSLCTIDTTMRTGRYILRVTNAGAAGADNADGSNQWGVVAKYTDQPETEAGLCDGRTDALCPRVYGRDAISVYANTSDGIASFFLAEIPGYHVGKTLELELWDPGEGGSQIEILQPDGTNSWTPHEFSWESFNDDGSDDDSDNDTMAVDVTGSAFNGRLLRIRIDLDDYDPPSDNQWWKIRYTFGSGDVTDRTTWSARVIGDPVHLVEEEGTD